MAKTRTEQRAKRHRRVRKKVMGTADRPRLCVYRSNKHISVQVINDDSHLTLVAANSYSPEFKERVNGSDKSGAEVIGQAIAEKAIAKGIKQVVFDCGGNQYHGRVQALADSARKAGLEF